MNNLLGLAISIASGAHVEQLDKGGNPYILHPLRLMMRLRTDDHELMMIAVLHDVVEDSPDWSFGRLLDTGFSDRVVDALRCLTHNSSENYDEYIQRVCSNTDAIKVKKEDLRDNSDITRLKGISDKDLLRTRKYHKAFVKLCDAESID